MSRMLNIEIHQQKPKSGPLGKIVLLILSFHVSKSKIHKICDPSSRFGKYSSLLMVFGFLVGYIFVSKPVISTFFGVYLD